ncbi:hypothetical protein NIES4071_37300 [Calothrix sp. NIES-4071]|nr:hypothetical protein NIES4071_37300 [Calothrix sp. NIES-4071]BAZ58047.1 hypothetical protein NIES4105_37230 [Calothrix sp. NIES-4105]
MGGFYSKPHYVYPSQVFFNYTLFEPYRFCLKLNLRPFTELFTKLNIHQYPDSLDAISVLEEISDKYISQEQTLSEQDRKILINCWKILEIALENQDINREIIADKLQNKRVVLTDKNNLKKPHDVFFKDRAVIPKALLYLISAICVTLL